MLIPPSGKDMMLAFPIEENIGEDMNRMFWILTQSWVGCLVGSKKQGVTFASEPFHSWKLMLVLIPVFDDIKVKEQNLNSQSVGFP